MTNLKYFLTLILIFISTLAYAENEVRKITPPKLDSVHLGEKILCHRPMRHGSPELKVELIGEKVVSHDYGHGGSGWTLGPGSARYVNDLLVKQYSKELSKNTPLTIIGAGSIGLFTAYDLYKRGYRNITILSDKFDKLTSHNAGGLLAPVSMDNDPELQKVIDWIGIDAYKFYAKIAKGKINEFKGGATIVPTYFNDRESSGLEPYVGKVMKPAKEVTLDFENGTTREMVAYDDGIFIDTAIMMESLTNFLKEKKVKFEKKKITSFDQIDSKFIFNCTGLGAKSLNNDPEMVSVQGHLIMLKNQNPKDLQHMILVYFGEDSTKSGLKVKRSFYIFPKHSLNSNPNDIGVIGGTFIENGTAETPNYEEFDILIKGAKEFYGIK